jgi:hypothetical protein
MWPEKGRQIVFVVSYDYIKANKLIPELPEPLSMNLAGIQVIKLIIVRL